MVIATLKDKILAADSEVWLPKVARILQFLWDEKLMEDLPRRFALLWEEIEGVQVHYQHNVLVDFVAYTCFIDGRKELTKRFGVYDEDMLIEDFEQIPSWDEIRLEPWEDGTGPLFDDLTQLDVEHLLMAQGEMLASEASDLHNYLSARLPAYSRYRQERMIATFLAMVLDEYSGRVAMLPEPYETDRLWGCLYSRISEYRALKKLREEVLLNDL